MPRLAAVVASVSVSIALTSLLVAAAAAAAVVEEARREEGEDDKEEEREEEREGGRPERGKVLWAVRPAFTGKPRSDGCP